MKQGPTNLLIVAQAIDQNDQALGFFHGWVEEFAKHADHILVICLKEGAHHLPKNVRVLSLGKEKGVVSSLTYAWRFYRAIWRERNNYSEVFVHMNPEYVILAGALWRLWKKYTLLWYAHGSVTLKLRLAVLLANHIVTSSASGMRITTRKRSIVGQGIDTEQFAFHPHTEDTTLKLITVGRISERKKIAEILPALDVLARRNIPFGYTLVGAPVTARDAHYMQHLQQEIAKRSYKKSISFAGVISHKELPSVLRETDVFVNLSNTGSMDKVVLESLASGVPALSANVAFKELLTPYGLYTDTLEGEAVAEKMLQASHVSKELLREEVVHNHSLEGLVARILALYPKA